MGADTRSLPALVRALARRYDAMAIGAARRPQSLRQDVENARRDAATLHAAADELEKGREP